MPAKQERLYRGVEPLSNRICRETLQDVRHGVPKEFDRRFGEFLGRCFDLYPRRAVGHRVEYDRDAFAQIEFAASLLVPFPCKAIIV